MVSLLHTFDGVGALSDSRVTFEAAGVLFLNAALGRGGSDGDPDETGGDRLHAGCWLKTKRKAVG